MLGNELSLCLQIVPVLTALTPKSSAESVTLLKVMSAFLLVCFQTQVLPEGKLILQVQMLKRCFSN